MEDITTIEDKRDGVVRYSLSKGEERLQVRLDVDLVREHGAPNLIRKMGHGDWLPNGRMKVFQSGQVIGTLPASFDPMSARSASYFYDMRPGDFKRVNGGWEADVSLGGGDLEAVPGFVWER